MSVVHRVAPSSIGHRVASALAGVAILGVLIVHLNHSLASARNDSEKLSEGVAIDARISEDQPMTKVAAEHPESPASRARTDMRAYAIRNDVVIESEETFTVKPEWRDQWSLYYVDVRSGDETVRVYEAVSRINPSRRFTAMCSAGADHATNWQLVLD